MGVPLAPAREGGGQRGPAILIGGSAVLVEAEPRTPETEACTTLLSHPGQVSKNSGLTFADELMRRSLPACARPADPALIRQLTDLATDGQGRGTAARQVTGRLTGCIIE